MARRTGLSMRKCFVCSVDVFYMQEFTALCRNKKVCNVFTVVFFDNINRCKYPEVDWRVYNVIKEDTQSDN